MYAYYAREALSKETKRLFHSPNSFDFFKFDDDERTREREEKRREKEHLY